jgi:predicted transcriptional regulator
MRSARRAVVYTTVAKTLTTLADKGLVAQIPGENSAYLYTARYTRDELMRLLVERMLAEFGATPTERRRLCEVLLHG